MVLSITMNKQIIITADDYGLCAAVNEAIEECLAAGAVSATCVMTNMPSCAQAAGLRGKFPLSSIGLHWNLTQGEPLLSPSAVPSLVGEDGRFAGSLRHRWWARQLNFAEMRAELVMQYERFRLLAGKPDFWNTHQDVHVFPGLFQLFVEVGNALRIPVMRSHERFTLPLRGSASAYHLRHPSYWAKGYVIHRWSERARAAGMRMPDGRLYLPGYEAGNYAPAVLVDRFDWRNVESAIELVIHPARDLDPSLGGLRESRLREYKLFRDAGLVGQIERTGVRVIGFNALRTAGCEGRREKAA
jgi:predicted glycoside hydrolase/deacetylase ChbG (UPF0249 family)